MSPLRVLNGLPSSPRIEPNQTWASFDAVCDASGLPACEGGENLLEMQLLPAVGDVNDFVRLPGFEPVSQRRQIGRRVIETAVALADERGIGIHSPSRLTRNGSSFGGNEPSLKTPIAPSLSRAMPFGEQFVHDVVEPRIVKTFAERVIELHAEPPVNCVELRLRQRDHLVPDVQIFGVAGSGVSPIPGVAASSARGICVAFGVDDFVEPLHFADGVAFERGADSDSCFQPTSSIAELRAPVADVIVGDDAVAEQPQRARERVAEDRGANVADVHRLGDVRRTEINDDGFRLRGFVEKQMLAARGGFERLRERGIFQPEIQEARAGDFHFLANIGNIEFGQHVGRRAGADSFCAPWPATSARCFGNRRISDRDTGGRERWKHRRPAKRRGRRLAGGFNLFVRQHGDI